MAQYQYNFYGSSYYGNTNAFSGSYETNEIDTDETLTGVVNVRIGAILPDVVYGPISPEIQQISGTWTNSNGVLSSSDPSASLKFVGTCDRIVIQYEQRPIAARNIQVQIVTTEPGQTPVTTNYTFSSDGAQNLNAEYVISNLPYGKQEVTITLSGTNPPTEPFYFKGIKARVTHFTIESRARLDNGSWTAYQKLNKTMTLVSGDAYEVTATTPNYSGKNRIQIRLWMASSDNTQTPEIQYLETSSGNTNNRTEDGNWTAVIDMQAVATAAGKTFSKVEEIHWTSTEPDTTELTIRSASSPNNVDWSKITCPYKNGVNRIRLKDGFTEGYIDTPLIAPASYNEFTRTVQWDKWEDQSFLPPDRTDTWVKYIFLDRTKSNESNPYLLITNPMDVADKNLYGLGNRDCYLRIRLHRRVDKATPVVDFVRLTSLMNYTEEKVFENQDFSAVDNDNTGKKIVLDLNALTFNRPPEVTQPVYELDDRTNRPQDLILYYDSEKDLAIRSNQTTNASDKVWVEAKVRPPGGDTGLVKHYQYGGGQVKYPIHDETEMAPIFTPALVSGIRYRYYLENGWPTQYHVVQEGDTLQSIADDYNVTLSDLNAVNPNPLYNNDGSLVVGQRIQIPNHTANSAVSLYWKSNDSNTTDKSAHNARIDGLADVSSDTIVAEVISSSTYGVVDWVSEEKIYSGIVNLNDIRSEYKRSHVTPESGTSADIQYVVGAGETYKSIAVKFGVDEIDLRIANNARDGQEPTPGQTILVPSRIVLPAIDPMAIVSNNPYVIEIIHNSVRKKDGTILPDDVMVVQPPSITYRTVIRTDVKIQRGPVPNGKDLLKDPRVTRIIKVTNLSKTVTYNEWDDDLQTGDFKLVGNYIDWSPASFPASEPAAGEEYYVTYECEVPNVVTITIGTTYQEEGGVDRIWRSTEVKEFEGTCSPGEDFVQELPPVTEWAGASDPEIEDIQYIVEDNDLWVKTWVEEKDGKHYVHASLQDRIPKENWFPTIKTGYYYLGKDEYYLFSEPIVLEPTEREIPMAENVQYVEGKYDKAALVQEGSTNLIRNSGFEVESPELKTVYKVNFANGVADLGITS